MVGFVKLMANCMKAQCGESSGQPSIKVSRAGESFYVRGQRQ
jgi:hypothetical protein